MLSTSDTFCIVKEQSKAYCECGEYARLQTPSCNDGSVAGTPDHSLHNAVRPGHRRACPRRLLCHTEPSATQAVHATRAPQHRWSLNAGTGAASLLPEMRGNNFGTVHACRACSAGMSYGKRGKAKRSLESSGRRQSGPKPSSDDAPLSPYNNLLSPTFWGDRLRVMRPVTRATTF